MNDSNRGARPPPSQPAGSSISRPEGKRNARNGHSVCSGDQMREMGGGGSAATWTIDFCICSIARSASSCDAWWPKVMLSSSHD